MAPSCSALITELERKAGDLQDSLDKLEKEQGLRGQLEIRAAEAFARECKEWGDSHSEVENELQGLSSLLEHVSKSFASDTEISNDALRGMPVSGPAAPQHSTPVAANDNGASPGHDKEDDEQDDGYLTVTALRELGF